MSTISASTTSTTAFKITTDTTGALVFQTGSSPTTAVTFNASQNVGIGTSSPGKKLVVSNAGVIGVEISPDDASSGTSRVFAYNRSTSAYTPLRLQGSEIYFGDATERMRLDTSGNLGLGVTPSAWVSSWRALGLGGSTGFGGSLYVNAGGTTGQIGLAQNWYYDGTNNRYITSAAASDYYQFGGAHVWRTAGSGTAGNTATLTQVMTLDVSGNLGVATTPDTSYKLTVQRTAGSSGNILLQGDNTVVGLPSIIYKNTNGGATAYLGFNGENVTAKGIAFPATQSASSDANTLDDYEEGSFTPEIKCTSLNGTRTYGFQYGYYVKIGALVWVYFDINIASWSGASGVPYIDLPFLNANLTQNYSSFLPWEVGTNFTGTTQQAAGYLTPGGIDLRLYRYGAGNSLIDTQMNINTTGRISGVITYRSPT